MKNKMALVSLALVAFGTVSTINTKPANAGTNGQQVAVSTGRSRVSVRVEGINQNGHRVANTWTTDQFGNAYTNGWWWKGNVTTRYTFRSGTSTITRTCTAFVPTVQRGDWTNISCR